MTRWISGRSGSSVVTVIDFVVLPRLPVVVKTASSFHTPPGWTCFSQLLVAVQPQPVLTPVMARTRSRVFWISNVCLMLSPAQTLPKSCSMVSMRRSDAGAVAAGSVSAERLVGIDTEVAAHTRATFTRPRPTFSDGAETASRKGKQTPSHHSTELTFCSPSPSRHLGLPARSWDVLLRPSYYRPDGCPYYAIHRTCGGS